MPAIPPLGCPACRGRISPEMDWRGTAYLQEEVCVGFECDDCSAKWDRDGTPKNPNFTRTDYRN